MYRKGQEYVRRTKAKAKSFQKRLAHHCFKSSIRKTPKKEKIMKSDNYRIRVLGKKNKC